MATKAKPGLKRGEDGLTKYQRYYQRHPEVKDKNRERERQRREKQKSQETSKQGTRPSDTEVKETLVQKLQNCGPNIPESSYTNHGDINRFTRPKDFFSLAPVFDEQIYNDTINSLTITTVDNHNIGLKPFHELNLLKEYRAEIVEWARGWGGVTLWDVALERSFNNAVEESRVELWREQLADHAMLGRKLLGMLHQMNGRLPRESWKIRELWRLRIELVEILVKGLTILELKTSILPSSCAVKYIDKRGTLDTDSESTMETDSDLGGGDGDVDEQAADSTDSE